MKSISLVTKRISCLLISSFCLGFLAMGCGGGADGPARFQVTGTVKYDGQPVPRGTISFFPNVAKGTEGPTGSAKIVDGKYDTRLEGGASPIAGELIIQVDGFGPPVPNEEFPKPLFKPYQTDLTMPSKAHVFDVDVPKKK